MLLQTVVFSGVPRHHQPADDPNAAASAREHFRFDTSVLPDPTCGVESDGLPCGDRRNTTTMHALGVFIRQPANEHA